MAPLKCPVWGHELGGAEKAAGGNAAPTVPRERHPANNSLSKLNSREVGGRCGIREPAAGLTSQFVPELLRVPEVGGVEALGEPVVDLGEGARRRDAPASRAIARGSW